MLGIRIVGVKPPYAAFKSWQNRIAPTRLTGCGGVANPTGGVGDIGKALTSRRAGRRMIDIVELQAID